MGIALGGFSAARFAEGVKLLLRDAQILRSQEEGVMVLSAGDVEVRNSLIEGNGHGIRVVQASGWLSLYENRIVGNEGWGIALDQPDCFSEPFPIPEERRVAKKVQKVSFKRGLRALPEMHREDQRPTSAKTATKVIGMAGPKGRAIPVGSADLMEPTKLQLYYDRAIAAAEGVEGQNLRVLIRLLQAMGIAGTIIDLIQLLTSAFWGDHGIDIEALHDGIDEVKDKDEARVKDKIEQRYEDWELEGERATPWTRALGKFIDGLRDALIRSGWYRTKEEALDAAIELLASFIATMERNGMDIASYLREFGPSVVIALALLQEVQENPLYAFPSASRECMDRGITDPAACLMRQLYLLMDLLLQYLVAMVYQAVHGGDKEIGLEGIARVTLLVQELFPRLKANGWTALAITVLEGEFNGEMRGGIYFVGDKRVKHFFALDGRSYDKISVFGWIEPYLKRDEVSRIIERIEVATRHIAMNLTPETGGTRYAVIEIVDRWQEGAMFGPDGLCTQIQNRSFFGVPVIVIRRDGKILCWKNLSPHEALIFCQAMGFPNCRLPEGGGTGSYTPTDDEPTDEDESTGSEGQPESSTQVVPQPASPEEAVCIWKFCLI
jgi:hypothetical protein